MGAEETTSIEFLFDGGGEVITIGVKGDLELRVRPSPRRRR